ncbi:MAG TPA: Spy/CpxP family protein refolding chaperone [Thermoanaerobaculia bacterium]|nr:Spy/CpxP family protein refolding chaperone [Thermoanaerobaculia bacterium]
MRILFSLLAAFVVVAGAALAGGHLKRAVVAGHGPHGMHMAIEGAPHAEELGLSEEQKAAATHIHEGVWAKAQPLMEHYHEQMAEIHAHLDAGNANPTEVGQKMIAAHATHDQIEALHEEGMEHFSALLTEEQRAKLQELKAKNSSEGMHMRMRIHH